jgi:hypothetical protein
MWHCSAAGRWKAESPFLAQRVSVGSTEAPEEGFCGSMRFCTLVSLDPRTVTMHFGSFDSRNGVGTILGSRAEARSMSESTARPVELLASSETAVGAELPLFTIFWKEHALHPVARTGRVQATDIETTREAAQLLIFEARNTVAVVLGVLED